MIKVESLFSLQDLKDYALQVKRVVCLPQGKHDPSLVIITALPGLGFFVNLNGEAIYHQHRLEKHKSIIKYDVPTIFLQVASE